MCGNGVPESGEDCDEGAGNSNAPNATCRTNCTPARCGDGIIDDLSGELCDEGAANSDAPNATCRTDCSLARCGDGIVDDGAGEECETDDDCEGAAVCDDCTCLEPLGTRVISASTGGFLGSPTGAAAPLGTVVGSLVLNAGPVDEDGIAAITTPPGPFYFSVDIALGGQRVCHRIQSCTGFVYCNGGINADVHTQIDSLAQGLTCVRPTTPPALANKCQPTPAGGPCCLNACEGIGVGSGNTPVGTVGINTQNTGPGTVVLVCEDTTVFGPLDSDCTTIAYGPDQESIYTTGTSTAVIVNECPPLLLRSNITTTGENFQCSTWTAENGPGKLIFPAVREEPTALIAGDVSAVGVIDD
jgi:hypothetical protein